MGDRVAVHSLALCACLGAVALDTLSTVIALDTIEVVVQGMLVLVIVLLVEIIKMMIH